jgi:hypothetical protein
MRKTPTIVALGLALVLGSAGGARAQLKGHCVAGGVAVVTNAKLFGGNWGLQALPLAFMKSRTEANSLDVLGSFHYSDLFVQSPQLGWHKPRVDSTVGWSLFAPTGKYTLGADDNGGLGMWSDDFPGGHDPPRRQARLTTALLATFEIHSHKEDSDPISDLISIPLHSNFYVRQPREHPGRQPVQAADRDLGGRSVAHLLGQSEQQPGGAVPGHGRRRIPDLRTGGA